MVVKSPARKRIGLVIDPPFVAREGTPIYLPGVPENTFEMGSNPIGRVTSGIPSPTLKQNIAMGYVNFGHHKIGTELEVVLRGQKKKATVVRMPFVKPNYYREPAGKKAA